MSNDYIDQIMGFSPNDLDVFQEKPSSTNEANVYKTNPVKLAKSDDGVYRSRVKLIYNPKDIKRSVVHQAFYAMTDENGFFMVRSKMGDGDRNCPLFKSWKKLWFSGDQAKKDWAKKMYEKNESNWVIVQILEDTNQPELVGKFMKWKFPATIKEKFDAKVNPSPESKKTPVPIMDYLFGTPLELVVQPGPDDPTNPQRKQREISYGLSEFETDFAPIIKTDGTSLFTDEEIEILDTFHTAKTDAVKAKTETKRAQATQTIAELTPQVRELYRKAINYLNDNCQIDLVAECGYQEWDEATTKRVQNWIDTVAAMKDPATENVNENNPLIASPAQPQQVTLVNNQPDLLQEVMNEPTVAPGVVDMPGDDPDGLPF